MFLLFIYLLFTLAMLSLWCYAQGFFSCSKEGGGGIFSSHGAWASHGFSKLAVESVPPELAGRLLTTEPQRSPIISDVERLSKVYGYNIAGRELI